jgi:hypothetical protein
MTKTKMMQHWNLSLMTAVALAASAGLCRAQSLITYDFASDLQGWHGNEPEGMAADYSWNATGGSAGGGCMQITFDGTTTTEMDPLVTLPAPLNQAQYLSVSIHMKVDAASGTTGNFGSGGYGNLQAIFRDAGYSWDSMWYGAVFPPAANDWVTYTFVIPQPYKSAEQYLQFQFQGNAGTGYSAPVTVYIDNITITPVPNPWVIDAFTSDTSSGYTEENWTGIAETSSWNTSEDAGGGFNPPGALQMDIGFPVADQWAAWGQSWVSRAQAMDPTRYTYFECDVKVDAANSTPFSDGSYGALTIGVRGSGYAGPFNCSPSGIALDSSFTSWRHLKLLLPTTATDSSLTNSPAYDIEVSGNYMGPVRLYFDNIQLTKPVTRPTLAGLKPGSPGGVRISVDGAGDQFDREALCVPAASTTGYTWPYQTPAVYAMTLTNFPSPATAPNFESHIFIVNESTIPSDNVWNETYGGCDWNASDLAILRVANGTNGGVVVNFEWKVNSPASNPTNIISARLPNLASANGTWLLNFSDDTTVNITGPGGVVTNFTLPADIVPNFASPANSFVQFGVFKNDNGNTGVNNFQSVIFTHVLVSNSVYGTLLEDSFGGPGLTANNNWRITSGAAVNWIPQGTAWWLQWGLPANGYTVQSTADLSGQWNDAGVTYIYTDATGTNAVAAVPASSLPVGNAAFFRLVNTNSP